MIIVNFYFKLKHTSALKLTRLVGAGLSLRVPTAQIRIMACKTHAFEAT